jgi:hypothetical protein
MFLAQRLSEAQLSEAQLNNVVTIRLHVRITSEASLSPTPEHSGALDSSLSVHVITQFVSLRDVQQESVSLGKAAMCS